MKNSIFNTDELKNLKTRADNGDLNACISLVDKMLEDKSWSYIPTSPIDDALNFRLNQMQEYLVEDYVNADPPTGSPSPDHYKAAYYYANKSAELGDVEGMFRVAWRYELGEGCPKSRSNAMFWWKKAMNKGHLPSKHEYESRRSFLESIGDLFS